MKAEYKEIMEEVRKIMKEYPGLYANIAVEIVKIAEMRKLIKSIEELRK